MMKEWIRVAQDGEDDLLTLDYVCLLHEYYNFHFVTLEVTLFTHCQVLENILRLPFLLM